MRRRTGEEWTPPDVLALYRTAGPRHDLVPGLPKACPITRPLNMLQPVVEPPANTPYAGLSLAFGAGAAFGAIVFWLMAGA